MVCIRKLSTGEIIATIANQIVPPKFWQTNTNIVLYSPDFPIEVLQGVLGRRLYCSVAGGSGEETILQRCRGVWGGDYIAALQGGLGRRLYCSVAGGSGRRLYCSVAGGVWEETILQCCRGVWGGDYIAVLQGGSGEETR